MLSDDRRRIWWGLNKLIAAASIVSVITRIFHVGLLSVLATVVSYYRQLLYPFFDVLGHIVTIHIPDWYRDLSIVSWSLSAIYIRVYTHYATLAHASDMVHRMMGDIPYRRDTEDNIVEIPPAKLWFVQARVIGFGIATGVLLLGYLLPVASLWVYLRPRLQKARATWQLVRYSMARKASVQSLYDAGDEYVVLRVQFVRFLMHGGALHSAWLVLSLYLTYIFHVSIIVILAFAINVGIWFAG